MPEAAAAPVTESTLKEMECAVLSPYYDQIIQEFENNPESFKNFRALKYVELHARTLSEDYLGSVRKNLITPDEQFFNIAKKFANTRSNYEIIKNAKEYLQNERMFEMLIKTLKECQNAASILASLRRNFRKDAVHEQLLSGNAVIQQNTAHIPHMQQQINLILKKIEMNQTTQPATVVGEQHIESPQVPSNNNANQQHPLVVERNASAPSWIVRQQDCESLKNSHHTKESFTRAYAQKLFTLCEILQPLNENPVEKENETAKVIQYFYGTDVDRKKTFESTMRNLRGSKRHSIFKKIDKTQIGYGITNSGTVLNGNLKEFYFKSPLGNEMKCFINEQCSSRLPTKLIGNFKVPLTCGDFEYILFIEKPDRFANFYKLFKDGTFVNLNN